MQSRTWLLRGAAIYVAIIVVVAVGLAALSGGARDRLDEALGHRLQAVAVTASSLLATQYGDSLLVWAADSEPSLELLWLETRLVRIQHDNEVAEITLCDPDGRVLVSTSGRLVRGDENVFWQLDPGAVGEARAGFASTSELYRRDDIMQKSAHAPLMTSDGRVAGVLTVEGSADFFATLRLLHRGALMTGAVVLVLLTLLGLLLLRLQRLADRWRESVQRQENLAAMGRMTAGIAHEIRNPLGIIRSTGQHLARRLGDAGIEDEMGDFIPAEVDRLDRILTGYLAFGSDTRAEAESVDVLLVARRTARLLEEDLAAAGVTIDIGAEGDRLRVEADPRRLQQVLLNLLLNARDAMPDGGTVTIDRRRDGRWCLLSIGDRGAGLGGATDEQLFSPFWTTREKGSGLGLAMARRIVEKHGGRLVLRDRDDGAGAVAEIRLPLRDETEEE